MGGGVSFVSVPPAFQRSGSSLFCLWFGSVVHCVLYCFDLVLHDLSIALACCHCFVDGIAGLLHGFVDGVALVFIAWSMGSLDFFYCTSVHFGAGLRPAPFLIPCNLWDVVETFGEIV